MADRTDVLNKDEIEEYKRQITQARNEENKRQAEFRVKYNFKAPEFVAHATHISQEEFKSSVGEVFAKYPADTDLVPAFSKGTQNEFNAEKSVKIRFDGDKLRALGRFAPYPERVFALATKQDEKGNPILDEQGRPVPQDGSYAYSLKKCCASINVVDDEIPLLIGFEERYADFESGEKTGHIYIGKGKDFKAEYDEHGNITEYTSDKEMVVTHHYKTTPKDVMEHNVQLVMFDTEADYEKWATEVRNKRNKFATFISSDDMMIKLLQEEIAAGRATYINATERGFNPKITALQTVQENINRTDKSQEFANADKITVAEPSVEHYQAFLTACKKMQDYIENSNTPDDIGKSVSRGFIFAKKEFLSLSEDEFKTKIVEEYAKRSQDGAAKPEYFRFILVGDKIAGYVNVRAMARDEFDVKYDLESCKKWDYISEHGARACISDVLLPEYRGMGIIGKAQKLFFDELREKGINEVSATVLADNASSNRAHNKMLDSYGGKTYQVHGDSDGNGVQYFNRYIINTDTSGRQKDNFKEELKAVLSLDVKSGMENQKDPVNRLVDGYTVKICSLLPEWNHSEAGKDADVAKQKLNFAAKMTQLKAFLHEKNITDEKQILRAMDLVIAKNVPDEHVRIVIDGEEHRAAHQAIAKDAKLQYKIPPQENHNLLNSAKTFHKQQLFTLVAPSKPDEIANILVAEKKIGNRTVGIVAVDSFMIEYGNADVLKKVDKIADYVLEQSKNWNDVVFDFRGNGGGDASIIKQIGERMSGKKLAYADKTEIIDKALTDRGGPPEQYMQKANDKTFTGNVYVLQDGGNSSAADGAIWMLRQTDNCITVGENTFGAFAGGDVKKHKIDGGTLLIGNTYRERYLPDGTKVEEGKGIPPDIKCASENAYDMAITLVKKTNMQMYLQKTDKANLSANQRNNMQTKPTLKTLADIKRNSEYNH